MRCIPLVFSIASAVVSGVVLADAVEWPADFWQRVTNHVEAVAPSGVQVASASESMSSFATVQAPSPTYGTASIPFSTIAPSSDDSVAWRINTRAPGIILSIR